MQRRDKRGVAMGARGSLLWGRQAMRNARPLRPVDRWR
jgi:hypothetical protein